MVPSLGLNFYRLGEDHICMTRLRLLVFCIQNGRGKLALFCHIISLGCFVSSHMAPASPFDLLTSEPLHDGSSLILVELSALTWPLCILLSPAL